MLLPIARRYTSTVFSNVKSPLLGHLGSIQTRKTTQVIRRAMATSCDVHLEASQLPQFYVKGLTAESADKTSKLLQLNHEKYHVFFNTDGFHNHIVHHLLTLFALNASPQEIDRGYTVNASYQRQPERLQQAVVNDMHDPSRFKAYLAQEEHYRDFLVYFQKEIDAKGWQKVLNEYLFAGDERANDMLVRCYSGLLHPLIQLGFGIEFQQPAIVAEALAETAITENYTEPFYMACDTATKANKVKGQQRKTIVQLLKDVKNDDKLRESAHWEDRIKIREGILTRAPEEMIKYASQFTVEEDELEERTAEMINASAYFSFAAQNPKYQVKVDFFHMHCINASIFFSNFLSPANTFISPATKCRLLEWKVRTELVVYVSRGCAHLDLNEITEYKPKKESGWDELFKRANKNSGDDGHLVKLLRALANGQNVGGKFEAHEGFVIKGDMWNKMGHMAIDSFEAGEPRWVRNCGFQQAWEEMNVPLRGDGLKL